MQLSFDNFILSKNKLFYKVGTRLGCILSLIVVLNISIFNKLYAGIIHKQSCNTSIFRWYSSVLHSN